MKAHRITGNIFKLAIFCACIYAVTKWQAAQSGDDDIKEFAEYACLDEIDDRYSFSSLSAYEVKKTDNGYTVRASATTARGTPVKVVCLTNIHGGVRDITINEG